MKTFQHNASTSHGSNDQIADRRVGQQATYQSGQTNQSVPAYVPQTMGAPATTAPDQTQNQPQNQSTGEPIRRDQELAVLFQQMRQITGVDREALAAHLYTTPEVFSRFEAGEIDAFPPWAETVRIVTTMATLVGIDSEPILERISHYSHQPCSRSRQAPPVTQEAVKCPPNNEITKNKGMPKVNLNRLVSALKLSLPSTRTIGVALIPVAMAFAFFIAPALDNQNRLSGPLGNYAKAGWEMLSWGSSSIRDGLLWIETEDPRSRKADKLTTDGS